MIQKMQCHSPFGWFLALELSDDLMFILSVYPTLISHRATVHIHKNNRTKILLISISFKAFKLYFIVSPFIKKWQTIIFGVFSILWVKRIRIELLFCHFNSSWQLIVMKEFWRSSTAEQSNSNLRFTHLSSRNLLRVILCDCQSSATGTPPCVKVMFPFPSSLRLALLLS